jgi:hypothetical protein
MEDICLEIPAEELRSGHFGDVCGEFNYGVLDYSVLVKSID